MRGGFLGGGEFGSAGGSGSGGGGLAPPSCIGCTYEPPKLPVPNFKITNTISLEYPCLSSSVKKAIDKNFSNEIQDLILDVFGESEDFNIEIEALKLGDSEDGLFNPGIVLDGGSYVNFTITINTLLEKSSKEYVTATIFHEFLHAYMTHLNLPKIRPDDQADHEEMANKYLEKLSLILIDQYGIKKSHAEALSWGGLGETKVFNDLYDSEKNYIGQINNAYKNGNKGTKCN